MTSSSRFKDIVDSAIAELDSISVSEVSVAFMRGTEIDALTKRFESIFQRVATAFNSLSPYETQLHMADFDRFSRRVSQGIMR